MYSKSYEFWQWKNPTEKKLAYNSKIFLVWEIKNLQKCRCKSFENGWRKKCTIVLCTVRSIIVILLNCNIIVMLSFMFFTDLCYPKTAKTLLEIIDGGEYNTYQTNTDMKVFLIFKNRNLSGGFKNRNLSGRGKTC